MPGKALEAIETRASDISAGWRSQRRSETEGIAARGIRYAIGESATSVKNDIVGQPIDRAVWVLPDLDRILKFLRGHSDKLDVPEIERHAAADSHGAVDRPVTGEPIPKAVQVTAKMPATSEGQLSDEASLKGLSNVERRSHLVQPGVANCSRLQESNRAADILVTLGLCEGVVKAGEKTLGHASAHFNGNRVIPGLAVVVDNETTIARAEVIKHHRINHKEIAR